MHNYLSELGTAAEMVGSTVHAIVQNNWAEAALWSGTLDVRFAWAIEGACFAARLMTTGEAPSIESVVYGESL